MIGTFGKAIVELVASWLIILFITGLYLWWPRRISASNSKIFGVILPRLSAKGRIFWKDLHSITGLWISIIIIFLVITGLPWSFAAGKTIAFIKEKNSGMQSGIGWDGGGSKSVKSAKIEQGWNNDHAQHLAGKAHSTFSENDNPLSIQEILEIAKTDPEVSKEFEIRLPVDKEGVYTLVNISPKPQKTAFTHLDQYSGETVSKAMWQDFGAVSKSISIGVALHEGRYFGWVNQLVNLAACIGLVFMVIAGFVMWLKRKPENSLGAPPKMNKKLGKGLIAIMIALGVIMPLFGASLVVIVVYELIARCFKKIK
jgi:uncharacterized iron-regulated membrane protein